MLENKKRYSIYKKCTPLIGGVLGIFVFCCIYGFSTLNVGYDGWIYAGYIEKDIVQSYAGWQYFRASAWHFPLGMMDNVAQPSGASVAYTDPYLIWALICKALSPILPGKFQYFGWVNLVNFFLQGVCAWLLLSLFTERKSALSLGCMLFLTMPVFIERAFRHSALNAQWLILLALYFYFKQRRTGRLPWWEWGTLVCLAPLVHAYFLPIVLAAMAASVLEYMTKNRVFWRCVWRTALCGAVCIALCFAVGLVMPGGGNSADFTGGYGVYSMNLNAPINPSSFNGEGGEALRWSAVLPVLPQVYHNYDGFNYFGLGVIAALCLLAAYGIFKIIKAVRTHTARRLFGTAFGFLRSHWALAAVCLCCTLFALSNTVCLGDKELFTIPIPGLVYRVASMFRSSGRIFYLVTYLFMLSLIVFAIKKFSAWLAAFALAVLLAVQVFDAFPVIIQKHEYFSARISTENAYTTDEWQWFMKNYSNAVCTNEIFSYDMAAGIIRYNSEIKSNMVFFNRGIYSAVKEQYAETVKLLASGAPLPDDTVYICSEYAEANEILAGLNGNARMYSMNGGDFYMIAVPKSGCPINPVEKGTQITDPHI